MAKNTRPVKIKRYKNNMGSSSGSAAAVKKAIVLILAAVLLVATGWFIGKPLFGFISNLSQNKPQSSQSTPSDQSESQSQPTQDASQPTGDLSPVIPVKNRIYYYVDTAALTNDAGISSVISDMKAKGATHCVFTLKNQDGYVLYNSQNKYASQLKAETVIDLGAVAEKLSENGITPVALVYTFMDKMISTVERTTAVYYQGTDTRWLDSSAALGGKAWANPASEIVQQYLVDLTDEIMSMGVKEFIYGGYSTPTGYSLDKRDFRATVQQVLAHMKTLITTLEGKVAAKGGYTGWLFDYSAVKADGKYEQYIVHPYQLGATNIIVTAKNQDGDLNAMVSEIKNGEKSDTVDSITLWITDGDSSGATLSMGNYFVK